MDGVSKAARPASGSKMLLNKQNVAGGVPLPGKWGGNKTLIALKASQREGLWLSAWDFTGEALNMLAESKGNCVIVVTMDLNHDGHPAIGVTIQPVTHVSEDEFSKRHLQLLKNAAKQRQKVIISNAKKLIKPEG